jgi:ABC-type lipoprotein release transport system permease subunit
MMVSTIIIFAVAGSGGLRLPAIVAQYLVGGGELSLIVSPRPYIEAIGLIFVVSLCATIYPVSVANAITPLKAMNEK